MTSIGFGLACIGCVLLSLSLRRHFKQVFADHSQFEKLQMPMRIGGYVCLGVAWIAAIAAAGGPIGFVLWLSMLALAAFTQALLLTYRPQGSTWFGGLGVVLMLIGAVA